MLFQQSITPNSLMVMSTKKSRIMTCSSCKSFFILKENKWYHEMKFLHLLHYCGGNFLLAWYFFWLYWNCYFLCTFLLWLLLLLLLYKTVCFCSLFSAERDKSCWKNQQWSNNTYSRCLSGIPCCLLEGFVLPTQQFPGRERCPPWPPKSIASILRQDLGLRKRIQTKSPSTTWDSVLTLNGLYWCFWPKKFRKFNIIDLINREKSE